jgi:polyisoprenoid-binding protein YceI
MITATKGAAVAQTTWKIDPAHTQVEFGVKHLMIAKVKGRFADVHGTIQRDERDITRSTVEVEIGVASIDTREPQRDAHLRSADFFDAETFPTLTFATRRIERSGEGRLRLIGDLTMHGVTREVVLDATEEGEAKDPWGGERFGFSATGTLDRRDFGLTWNQALETGGLVVGNDVKISLEVEAVREEE